MKKNSAIYAVTTAIVILLASLIGCDCAVANDWGFGPIEPEAETVEAANILAMKTQDPCPGGVCPVPMAVSTLACPNCPTSTVSTASVVPPGYHAHRAHDGSIVVHHDSNFGDPVAHRGMSWTRIAEAGDTINGATVTRSVSVTRRAGAFGVLARGNGYGVFGLRARPWFWRVRPFLRAQMGW